jgi:branched-chain amino acid transport system permease protein
MDFYFGVFSFAAIYGILAMSYTLVHGVGGMFTVAHAVFFGVGAYAAALISQLLPPGLMVLDIVAATLVTLLAGAAIGLAALKQRGQYMMLITFSIQIIFSVFLVNTHALGGEDGISTIPPFRLGPLVLSGSLASMILLWVLTGLSFAFFRYLTRSDFGRTVRAIREDELAVEAVGVNVFRMKWLVFSLTAGVAGFAGALFAHLTQYISPNSFNFDAAILIVTISVLGGQFSYIGAVVGALIVMWLPILVGYLGIPGSQVAAIIQLIFGCTIIVMLYLRPAGIVGESAIRYADPEPGAPRGRR